MDNFLITLSGKNTLRDSLISSRLCMRIESSLTISWRRHCYGYYMSQSFVLLLYGPLSSPNVVWLSFPGKSLAVHQMPHRNWVEINPVFGPSWVHFKAVYYRRALFIQTIKGTTLRPKDSCLHDIAILFLSLSLHF